MRVGRQVRTPVRSARAAAHAKKIARPSLTICLLCPTVASHANYGTSELFFSFLSLGLLLQIFVPVALTTGRQDRGILIDKRHRGRPDLRHVPKNRAPGSPKSTVDSCNGSAGPSARPHAPPGSVWRPKAASHGPGSCVCAAKGAAKGLIIYRLAA